VKHELAMVRIQRILVSLIMRSGAGVLRLRRGQPHSEFLRHDPDTQVGIDLWELPGGGLDFGGTPLQAAVRETSEGTGILIEGKNLKLVACCAYTLKGSKHSKEHAAYQWVQDKNALQDLPMRKPMVGIATCCARAASGQVATALPRNATNLRRCCSNGM